MNTTPTGRIPTEWRPELHELPRNDPRQRPADFLRAFATLCETYNVHLGNTGHPLPVVLGVNGRPVFVGRLDREPAGALRAAADRLDPPEPR